MAIFRSPQKNDHEQLIELAIKTKLFTLEDACSLLGSTLDAYFANRLKVNSSIIVLEDNGNLIGWAYYAESDFVENVWDIWWIGLAPEYYRKGYGNKLLAKIEVDIKSNNGRLIIIETSSGPLLESARNFYTSLNYSLCGEVPDFYSLGENKLIFSKSLK